MTRPPSASPTVPAAKTVLFSSGVMARRTGTEIWVEENALALVRRGWRAQVLAGTLGPLAEHLAQAGIPVSTTPAALPFRPDVILGSFTIEMLRALAAFPGVPALWLQHDGRAGLQHPFHHPRLVGYAGVDDFCRERIQTALHLPPESVAWLPNRVNLERFQARTTPLPATPRCAAIFSNQAKPGRSIATIHAACAQRGIDLDVWGEQSGRPLANPAAALPAYDLVFAKARCALEALACGCAVVLCDELGGLGPLVTVRDWPRLRRWNLGQRVLGGEITIDHLLDRIASYDANDTTALTAIVRRECDLHAGVDQLEQWLDQARLQRLALSPEAELTAFASALEGLGPMAEHVQRLEIAAYGRWPDGAPLKLLQTLHRWQHRLRPFLRRWRFRR